MNATARATYLGASVTTASPARLLLMLCDRLVLDVGRAVTALEAAPGDPEQYAEASRQLRHAQDVVAELRAGLRPEACAGGPGMAAVYDYLHAHLVRANVRRDPVLARECLTLAESVADTWHAAARTAAGVA